MKWRLVGALLLATWPLSTPAFADVRQDGNLIQFSYQWGRVERTFTDASVTVTVTNNITNKIGWNGEVIDTYRLTLGSQVIEVTEKHYARTYTFEIVGTQTLILEGIDNGYWGGFYGPVMQIESNPLTPATLPVSESPTVSPDVSESMPVTQSAEPQTQSSASPESESTVVTPQPEPIPSPEPPAQPTPEPSPTPPPTPEPKPIVKDESSANSLVTAMDDYFYSWGIDFEYYSADPRVQEFVQNRAQRTMCILAQNWVCAIDYNAAMGYSFRAVLKGFQEGNLYHQEVITNSPLVSQSPVVTPEPSPTPETSQPEPTPTPEPSPEPTASSPTKSPEPEQTESPTLSEPIPTPEQSVSVSEPLPTASPEIVIVPLPQSSEESSEEPSSPATQAPEVTEETESDSVSGTIQTAISEAIGAAVEAVGELVEVFASAGLDMTAEQREEAQDVVVSSIIVSQVASAASVTARKIK